MSKPADLNRCLAPLDQEHTIIAVIEMSQSSWLVAGVVPGIARHPLKKLAPDQDALLKLLHRWREEAGQAGRAIRRIAVAFEAGRDGFWLARWLRAHGIEAHVIHPTNVAVSREHRRAKTDRLETALLKRVFLGWLRGEPEHCPMAAIPTLEEEDGVRPPRRARLASGRDQLDCRQDRLGARDSARLGSPSRARSGPARRPDHGRARAHPGAGARSARAAPSQRDPAQGERVWGDGGPRPPFQAMIAFIDEHRAVYGVEPICRVLPIAPSTYHAHAARRADPKRLPARARRDAALMIEIR